MRAGVRVVRTANRTRLRGWRLFFLTLAFLLFNFYLFPPCAMPSPLLPHA